MMACEYSGKLDELLNRPAGELWIFGSDGDDDDDTGSDDDDSDDEDDEDDDSDDEDDSKKSKKSAKPKPKTAAEVAAMERRIANFDEERDRDKGKLKKANDSIKEKDAEIKRLTTDGVKDEEVKQKNAELERENASLKSANDDLRIQIAFLGDTTHKWANPARAVKLLDRENIEIDANGRVTGLKAAADGLAESDSYLLVQKSNENDDDDKDGDKPEQRRTGDQPGSARRGKNSSRSQQARDDKLKNRFPGLRNSR